MEFLIESTNNEILINKYNKSDLVLRKEFIIFIGRNKRGVGFKRKNKLVHMSQIAEFENYLYIPEDQIPKDTIEYEYIKPIKQQVLQKYQWKAMKNKYPYKGV